MGTAEETMKPHIAILPGPGMGHIIPLLEFAKHLVINHNCLVSFLVIRTEASDTQTRLLESPLLPSDLHVINLPPADVLFQEDMLLLTRICVIIHENLGSIRAAIEQNRPDALVIDIFCTEAIDICDELSIPPYFFFPASTYFLSFSLYLPTLDKEVDCQFRELPGPIHAPGCNPIPYEDLIDQVKDRNSDDYKWILFHSNRLTMATGIFINSFDELEPVTIRALRDDPFYKRIGTPPIHPIGPLVREDEPLTETDAECLNWLDTQPTDSVLYISLGSGGTLTSDQMTEFAHGLEMSKQRFIWVVRKTSDASASGAYLTAGEDADEQTMFLPEGFTKRTEGIGLVIRSWAPQVSILSHPSTGGFLTHCGWNSTLESVVHGVPMIAWPLYAEQKMNAKMLSKETGIAIKPRAVEPGKGLVGRNEIERVVRMVLEGEEGQAMRKRARELKESAAKVLNNGGSSKQELSRVVDSWKCCQLKSTS
ncbi:UDP-glucuronosyl/UDP-glucosyltransferase [Dillenia turbinata]|uniref:Glycosyltransferase n=1 Tax=Dillenia turbinata TaxID=194707 RepID=A0AAN8W112_9MAGN